MTTHAFTDVSPADLDAVTGGSAAAIGQRIGGLVDSFTGGSGKGAQIGGQIGGLVDSFIGRRRGGGEGGGPPPQESGDQTSVSVQTGG
jgi:hypothetical protein